MVLLILLILIILLIPILLIAHDLNVPFVLYLFLFKSVEKIKQKLEFILFCDLNVYKNSNKILGKWTLCGIFVYTLGVK